MERIEKGKNTPEQVIWQKIENALDGRGRHERATKLMKEIGLMPTEEKRVFVKTLDRFQKDLESRREENDKELRQQLRQGNWLAPLAGVVTTLLLQVVPEGSTGDIRTDTITGVAVGVTSLFMLRIVPLIKEALSYNIADQEKELAKLKKSREVGQLEEKYKELDEAVSKAGELLKNNDKPITIYHNQYGLLTPDVGSPKTADSAERKPDQRSADLVKSLGNPKWQRDKIRMVLDDLADVARNDLKYDIALVPKQVPNYRNGLTEYGPGWEWTFTPRSA